MCEIRSQISSVFQKGTNHLKCWLWRQCLRIPIWTLLYLSIQSLLLCRCEIKLQKIFCNAAFAAVNVFVLFSLCVLFASVIVMIRNIPLHIPPIFSFSHFKLNHKLLCCDILLICSCSIHSKNKRREHANREFFCAITACTLFNESLMSLLAQRVCS